MTVNILVFVGSLIISFSMLTTPAKANQESEILKEEATSGAAASDPTAAVNFQDLRYRYF